MPVEVIEAAIKVFTMAPIFQEALTRQLAECLQCHVETTGSHGKFRTTCES
jgi:GTP cyclohydrolase I